MPDHAIQRLDGIGRVDHLADVCRVGKERGQIGPVCLPAPAYRKRLATGACKSGYGIVSLELHLI